jgi:hypothetical protein
MKTADQTSERTFIFSSRLFIFFLSSGRKLGVRSTGSHLDEDRQHALVHARHLRYIIIGVISEDGEARTMFIRRVQASLASSGGSSGLCAVVALVSIRARRS